MEPLAIAPGPLNKSKEPIMPEFKQRPEQQKEIQNRLPIPLDVHQGDITALAYGGIRPVTVAVIYGEDDEERLARANEMALCINLHPCLLKSLENAIEMAGHRVTTGEHSPPWLVEARDVVAKAKGEKHA